jgi:hypothetical protein
MSTAEEFRRRADLCERRAATGGLTYSAKGRILRLAARWHEMADDAERVAAVIDGSDKGTSGD